MMYPALLGSVEKAMADGNGEWISPNWSVFERGGAIRMVSPG